MKTHRMTSIALLLVRTWQTHVHQMPHPLGLVLLSAAVSNFGKGVLGSESGHRLLLKVMVEGCNLIPHG